MTENTATGLKITQRFTKKIDDPFDSVEWETRDVAISGGDGNNVFEQFNVEAPKEWSQLSTQIVASKYFAGKQGTKEREDSIRTMISRVANTITNRGIKEGL